jgi:prepilin-type N-terminal cleavage/methylation domain-containing protein
MKNNIRGRIGFTLVEIMIVVAIIGLLASIAIPNFVHSRTVAQMNSCISNLRCIDSAAGQRSPAFPGPHRFRQFAVVSGGRRAKLHHQLRASERRGQASVPDPYRNARPAVKQAFRLPVHEGVSPRAKTGRMPVKPAGKMPALRGCAAAGILVC